MNDKSHVTLLQRFCLNCGENYETGELGLSTRVINGELEKKFDRYTVVGPGLCPDCTKELTEKGAIQVFAAKKVGKDKMEITDAYVINEEFLRDICPDMPELPDRIVQVCPNTAKTIRKVAEIVLEGVKAKLAKDAENEKCGQPES